LPVPQQVKGGHNPALVVKGRVQAGTELGVTVAVNPTVEGCLEGGFKQVSPHAADGVGPDQHLGVEVVHLPPLKRLPPTCGTFRKQGDIPLAGLLAPGCLSSLLGCQ
jgi:hypothetical protein